MLLFRESIIRSSSSQKKSEIKKKNHVRRCSLLRESRRPDDANEFRADETRERETGESVEKPNRREGTFFRFSMMMMLVFVVVFFFCFFFLPFILALGCVLLCVGRKRLIFRRRPNGESAKMRRRRRGRSAGRAREKKTKKIASRALSRARGRRTLSRASVATRVVFPFSGEIGTKDRGFCASAGFIFFLSRLLKEPGRTKEEEKRALVYAENESTTKTHETPSFFLEPKQTTDRHRDHGAGCSLHRLPGSVPRGAKRRRASRRRRTVVGRRRLGRDFVLLFVLVGARRVGTIGLVREREKRNKVRNHSKSTQNTSEREKKECVCIDKTRENERERERVKRERGSTSYGGASLLRVRLRRLFRVDVCKERGLLLLLLLHYYLRARARSRVVPSVPKGKRALLLLPFSLVPHTYHFSFSFFNALMKPQTFLDLVD